MVGSLQVFSSGSIGNVCVQQDDRWIVSGSNQLAVVHSGGDASLEVQSNLQLSDWVWLIHLLPQQVSNTLDLAIGLANNAVEIWRYSDATFSKRVRFHQDTRCITYSMDFVLRQNQLWVASGTVYNEILLWKLSESIEDSENVIVRSTDHRLLGHEGVLHSVRFDRSAKYLVSTSDDRSVRLWKEIDEASWTCVWAGWEHTARVWASCFFEGGVVTSAEDATLRIWNWEGKVLGQIHADSCQCLWKVDCLDDTIAVARNDGTVGVHCLSQTLSMAQSKRIYIPDDPPHAPDESSPQSKKAKLPTIPVDFAFADDRIVVATRAGNLLSYSLTDHTWQRHSSFLLPKLRGTANCIATRGSKVMVEQH